MVRNSFAKPAAQVQNRGESTPNPRKRRRLVDHTVSIYSSGPSQQSFRALELDFPPEQEPLHSGCSECYSSCDGCSSCCDECLHSHEGNEPDPRFRDAYHGDGQQDSGECSLSDEVFHAHVSSDLDPSTACSPRLGRWRSGLDGPDHRRIFHR